MKKIFFLLIAFISFLLLGKGLGMRANAQSFEKGNKILNFQLGFTAMPGTIKHNNDTTASLKTGAVGITLSPGMEWAVGKRISLGASLLYAHYLDSSKT